MQPAGLRVFPPLLLISGRSTQYLNVSGMDKAGAAEEVSLSHIFPFPAQEFTPLVGGLEPGAESLCAALRCVWTSAQAASVRPELSFSAWLIPAGSDKKTDLTVNLLGVTNQEQARVFLLEFELPELKPGGHSLHIVAEDPATKESSEIRCGLTVVLREGSDKSSVVEYIPLPPDGGGSG